MDYIYKITKSINRDLVPSKLFYINYYAALWAFLPVFAHYLHQEGYSPADMVILLGITPFTLIVSRLTLGDFADRSGKYKLVMITCLTMSVIGVTALYFVPPVSTIDHSLLNKTTIDQMSPNGVWNRSESDPELEPDLLTSYLANRLDSDNLTDNDPSTKRTHFSSYQMWLIVILYIAAYPFGMLPAVSLMDTITLGLLKDKPQNFGNQRAWMVLGATFTVPLTGYISDRLSQPGEVNYTPNFVCFVIFMSLACLSITLIKNPFKTKASSDNNLTSKQSKRAGILEFWPIIKEKWQVQTFMFACFVFGLNFGQSIMLAAPYMKELGSNQFFVMTAVMSIGFSVLIMMFLSGRIIRTFGHELTICTVLSLTALRAMIWSLASSHWFFVITEPLYGISFGLILVTVGSYSRKVAPPGAEATAQSIISSAYEGLGAGIGQIVSGSIHHAFGAAIAWRCFSILTFFVSILYFILLFATKRSGVVPKQQNALSENNIKV